MQQFYAAPYTHAMVALQSALCLIVNARLCRQVRESFEVERGSPIEAILDPGWKNQVRGFVARAITECRRLPVGVPFKLQLERVEQLMEHTGLETEAEFAEALTLLMEMQLNATAELAGFVFLLVDNEHKDFYRHPETLFDIEERFGGEVFRDVGATGRCIALEEWTAAVFHLMRVVELGLHDMAVRLKVEFKGKPMEHLEMGKIIGKLEAKIREMRDAATGVRGKRTPRPATMARNLERVNYYSEAGQQFWFFKEAWRNHVMHAHVTYDKRVAMQVYRSVKAFMEHLAKPAPHEK